MAKGSGTTRTSGSRNPQGISNQVNRGGGEEAMVFIPLTQNMVEQE